MRKKALKEYLAKRKRVLRTSDRFETRFDNLPGSVDLADCPIINVVGMVCMEPSSHNHEDPEIPVAVYAGAHIH